MKQEGIKAKLKIHKNFTDSLFQLTEKLLNKAGVKYHTVEKRTKTLDSITEKLDRKEIQNVEDLTDITGLRIILYYQDDVDRVEEIIRTNFEIDKLNSVDKSKLYNSNEFGYLSVHYIISLSGIRITLPEWSDFHELKAELQIRTVLQHSWASISHELSYKKSYDVPKELERRLFRLAGLFELADEQFLRIRDEHNNLKDKIGSMHSQNKIEKEKVTFLTISYLFQPDKLLEIVKEIEDIALEAGFRNIQEPKLDDKYVSELVTVCKIAHIETIEQLVAKLEKVKPFLMDYYNELLNINEKRHWRGDAIFYVILALLYSLNEKQLKEFHEQNVEWAQDTLTKVVTTISEQWAVRN